MTGKFQIDAMFVELEGSNVRLRKIDGTHVTIPLQMLSDNDQAVVQQLTETPLVERNEFRSSRQTE